MCVVYVYVFNVIVLVVVFYIFIIITSNLVTILFYERMFEQVPIICLKTYQRIRVLQTPYHPNMCVIVNFVYKRIF